MNIIKLCDIFTIAADNNFPEQNFILWWCTYELFIHFLPILFLFLFPLLDHSLLFQCHVLYSYMFGVCKAYIHQSSVLTFKCCLNASLTRSSSSDATCDQCSSAEVCQRKHHEAVLSRPNYDTLDQSNAVSSLWGKKCFQELILLSKHWEEKHVANGNFVLKWFLSN